MTTLISFLGGAQGKKEEGYRTTDYIFDDGERYDNESYFALALAKKITPTRLVLFGTSGSMWDVFFEAGLVDYEKQWEALTDAVQNNSVTESQLQVFEKFLTDQLGYPAHCYLIDYAKDIKGQVAILQKMDAVLNQDEVVVMDVTHGFRHLPMIALVAAQYLQVIKNITIEHLYYGQFMRKGEPSLVIELKGLLEMLSWVTALSNFDNNGNYAVFEPLLTNAGLDEDEANQLSDAAFYERVMNASDASRKLQQIAPKLEELNNTNNGLYSLFHNHLTKRLDWFKRSSLGLQEQGLAEKYLNRGDFLRAVIYAMEGLTSRKVEQEQGADKLHDFAARKQAYEELRDNSSFKIFKEFRNAMVHGIPSGKKEVNNRLKEASKLEQSLKDRIKHLFKNQ